MPLDGEVREEQPDLVGPQLGGVTFAVEEYEAPDPVCVSLFGAEAEVAEAGRRAHPVEQSGSIHG